MKFCKVDDKKIQVSTVQAILTLWPPGGITAGGLEKILGDDDHDYDNVDGDGGDNDDNDNGDINDDGDDEKEEDSIDEQAFISD